MKKLFLSLSVLFTLVASGQIDSKHLQVGEQAPLIEATDQKGNKIMKDYEVAFEVNETNVPNYYKQITELVNEYNSESEKVLPVPATYLIGKDGRIEYVQYDPDYSNRSDISKIVNSL